MINKISVDHVTLVSDRDFEEVIRSFESRVRTLEDDGWNILVKDSKNYTEFEMTIKSRLGDSDFMRFFTVNHGEWVTFYGISMKSVMYIIGNPLIAIKMIKHDFEAGLDVPVRINIYEHKDGKTRFVYNKPSTLMGALHNTELHKAALKLDEKMLSLGKLVTGTAV